MLTTDPNQRLTEQQRIDRDREAKRNRERWAAYAANIDKRREFELINQRALSMEMFGCDDPDKLTYGQREVFNAEFERREALPWQARIGNTQQ